MTARMRVAVVDEKSNRPPAAAGSPANDVGACMPNARSTNLRALASRPRSSTARAYSASAKARNPGSLNSRPDRASSAPRWLASTRAARSATACRFAVEPAQRLFGGAGDQSQRAVVRRLVAGRVVDGVGNEPLGVRLDERPGRAACAPAYRFAPDSRWCRAQIQIADSVP